MGPPFDSEQYSEFQVNVFSNNKDIRLHLENSKSKKGHNCVKKIGGLPPLLVWVPLLIVNNYSEFQVNIFSNNGDIRKCQSFHTMPPPTTPGLCQYLIFFFENSQAYKNRQPLGVRNLQMRFKGYRYPRNRPVDSGQHIRIH